jgi:hypothetical protein
MERVRKRDAICATAASSRLSSYLKPYTYVYIRTSDEHTVVVVVVVLHAAAAAAEEEEPTYTLLGRLDVSAVGCGRRHCV